MTDDRADEIIRHFDVVAEALGTQIAQVGEGVVLSNDRLGRVDARLDLIETRAESFGNEVRARFDRADARAESLENEVRAGFAEMKSMIKLSYVELEGRMSTLERELVDLRSRVQKLEARG